MRAYAPGSVTGFFAPPPLGGPSTRSRGASFATEAGIVAEVAPAETVAVRVDGEPCPVEPVSGVLERLGAMATVDLTLSIPLGAGFGASGAATLATALAANAEFDLGRSRSALVDAAHRAEVAAGTGLGDVFVQAGGGLVWRTVDEIHSAPLTDRVEYVSYGPISTSEVLADDGTLDRIREAGNRAIERLSDRPTMREFTALSWAFARETGLVTDRVAETVERVHQAGGAASMSMLGETVFAVGVEGVLPNETHVTPDGAAQLDS